MAEHTGIEWCDHTMNFWLGCTKVSPACDHCYAERLMDHRMGRVEWGGERVRTSEANWRQPYRWNEAARKAGVRRRVFTLSLGDFFDNQVPEEWRHAAWQVIADCRHLDWLILTKRPQNIAKMLPRLDINSGPWPWPHVWLGTTAENQEEADRRIPHLLAVPAAKRFISAEPLLGPIDLPLGGRCHGCGHLNRRDGLTCEGCGRHEFADRLDWVITGGESGPGARGTARACFQSLRDQCEAAGIAYFHKQNGEWIDADEWLDQVTARVLFDGVPWQPARPLNYTDAQIVARQYGNRQFEHHSDGTTLIRVGKAAAGRLLDGIEHNEMPA